MVKFSYFAILISIFCQSHSMHEQLKKPKEMLRTIALQVQYELFDPNQPTFEPIFEQAALNLSKSNPVRYKELKKACMNKFLYPQNFKQSDRAIMKKFAQESLHTELEQRKQEKSLNLPIKLTFLACFIAGMWAQQQFGK